MVNCESITLSRGFCPGYIPDGGVVEAFFLYLDRRDVHFFGPQFDQECSRFGLDGFRERSHGEPGPSHLDLSKHETQHLRGYRILQAIYELSIRGNWVYSKNAFSICLEFGPHVETFQIYGTPTFLGDPSNLSTGLQMLLHGYRIPRSRVEPYPEEFMELSTSEISYG